MDVNSGELGDLSDVVSLLADDAAQEFSRQWHLDVALFLLLELLER